tara:strand:+ start:1685 stop:3334 length:1650 start_codon:yes stop_codon:yes gene_type:complete
MLNSLLYILFFLFCFYSGRGLLTFFELVSKKMLVNRVIFKIPIWIFYPIIYLFFIGNIINVVNFFQKGLNLFTILLLVLPIIFNFFRENHLNINSLLVAANTFCLFLLGLSTNKITFHQDAASYHLNNQAFIRSEKIILGLSNLHVRYGFSSMSEYVNSFFWFQDNFIFVHFVNLIFVSVFYIFLIWVSLLSKDIKLKLLSITLALYGILDNFGIEGGKNGYFDIDSIGKQDTAFGILFFFCNLFIILQLNKSKKYSNIDMLFLLLLITFTIQYRIFGFTLLIGVLFIILKFKSQINLSIFLPPIVIGSIWSLKNYLISSCLVFPIEITCLNSKWKNTKMIRSQSEELRFFHRSYNFWEESLLDWYFKWSDRYLNYYISINLLISFVIIIALLFLFFKIDKENFLNSFWTLAYSIVMIFLWLISAPSIRFGYGLFLLICYALSNFFHAPRKNITKKLIDRNIFLISIIFVSIVGTPLFSNYESKSIFDTLRGVYPEQIDYVKSDNWGVRVDNRMNQNIEFCWINKLCIPPIDFEIKEINFNGYRLITTE